MAWLRQLLTHAAFDHPPRQAYGRSNPLIKDFVPLAGLNDLVFGGWDIYEDTAYEAAANARVLDTPQLEKLKEPLSAIKPMKAVFDQEYVKRINGPNVKDKGSKMDKAEMLMDDIRQFQEDQRRFPLRNDLVRIHGSVPPSRRRFIKRSRISNAG